MDREIEHLWRRALFHRHNGRLEEAASLLIELAQIHPTAEVYTAIAEVMQALGEVPKAYGAYKLALEQDPRYEGALFGLGELHRSEGRLEDAAQVYAFTLKCYPNLTEAHLNLGTVLARMGNHDEAEVCFLNALRLAGKESPLSGRILFNLARLYAVTDRPEGAIDALLAAGVINDQYAVRGCLDDAFVDARERERFEKVFLLAERALYAQMDALLRNGQEEDLRFNLMTYPYLERVVRTRPAFARFRPFLPPPA